MNRQEYEEIYEKISDKETGKEFFINSSSEIKDNFDFCLEAIRTHGTELFKYVSNRLKENSSFISNLLIFCNIKDINELEGLSQRMKKIIPILKDIQSANRISSNDFSSLKNAPIEIRGDRDFILAAVNLYGYLLKYATDELKDDEFVVWVSFSDRDGSQIMYASERLRSDKNFAKKALYDMDKTISGVNMRDGSALEYLSDELKKDKELVTLAYKSSPTSLKFAHESLKDDKDFLVYLSGVYAGMSQYDDDSVLSYNYVMEFASEELKKDKDFILKSFKKNINRNPLPFLSDELLEDAKFINELIEIYANEVEYYDREFFESIPSTLYSNKEFVRDFVKICLNSDELLEEDVLDLIDRKLWNDKDLVKDILSECSEEDYEYLEDYIDIEEYIEDYKHMSELDRVAEFISNFLSSQKTENMNDIEKAKNLIDEKGVESIRNVSDELKNNIEFMSYVATKSLGFSLAYASDELLFNEDFIKKIFNTPEYKSVSEKATKVENHIFSYTMHEASLETGERLRKAAPPEVQEYFYDREVILNVCEMIRSQGIERESNKEKREQQLWLPFRTIIEFLPIELRSDKDLMLYMVERSPLALKLLPDSLKLDRDIIETVYYNKETRVRKQFYNDFYMEHDEVLEGLEGYPDPEYVEIYNQEKINESVEYIKNQTEKLNNLEKEELELKKRLEEIQKQKTEIQNNIGTK